MALLIEPLSTGRATLSHDISRDISGAEWRVAYSTNAMNNASSSDISIEERMICRLSTEVLNILYNLRQWS